MNPTKNTLNLVTTIPATLLVRSAHRGWSSVFRDMEVDELRKQVKQRIESVQEEYLLEEILKLIDFESDKEEVFSIPAEHQRKLGISVEQMKSGDTVYNQAVTAVIKETYVD